MADPVESCIQSLRQANEKIVSCCDSAFSSPVFTHMPRSVQKDWKINFLNVEDVFSKSLEKAGVTSKLRTSKEESNKASKHIGNQVEDEIISNFNLGVILEKYRENLQKELEFLDKEIEEVNVSFMLKVMEANKIQNSKLLQLSKEEIEMLPMEDVLNLISVYEEKLESVRQRLLQHKLLNEKQKVDLLVTQRQTLDDSRNKYKNFIEQVLCIKERNVESQLRVGNIGVPIANKKMEMFIEKFESKNI